MIGISSSSNFFDIKIPRSLRRCLPSTSWGKHVFRHLNRCQQAVLNCSKEIMLGCKITHLLYFSIALLLHLGVITGETRGESSAWIPSTLALASSRDTVVLDSLTNITMPWFYTAVSLLYWARPIHVTTILSRDGTIWDNMGGGHCSPIDFRTISVHAHFPHQSSLS